MIITLLSSLSVLGDIVYEWCDPKWVLYFSGQSNVSSIFQTVFNADFFKVRMIRYLIKNIWNMFYKYDNYNMFVFMYKHDSCSMLCYIIGSGYVLIKDGLSFIYDFQKI